jgi:hypothetical protein
MLLELTIKKLGTHGLKKFFGMSGMEEPVEEQ